jgi:hypothetical protein
MPLRPFNGLGLGLAGLLACCTLLACLTAPQASRSPRSVQAPFVVWFDDYHEVLEGSVDWDPVLRAGFVDLHTSVSGVRCVGPTQLIEIPPEADPPRLCEGMRGLFPLRCNDGRLLQGVWRSEARCGVGYGDGRDSQGNGFRAAYGMDAETARVMVREALADLASRPPLPSQSAVGTTRGLRSGTAFFVTPEGHLVTNHHVVDGAERIQVALDGSELLDVSVVDTDPRNDLAVLKVQAIRMPLPVRRAHDLVKGEQVFTLGYPLLEFQGREQKATFGRVNALTGIAGDDRFAQIDVPIQPGSSGGPLLNTRGEVVGVVTAMLNQQLAMQSAGVVPQNVNYALKSDVLHDLLRYNLGPDWSEGIPVGATGALEDLVRRAEESVVIVLAE